MSSPAPVLAAPDQRSSSTRPWELYSDRQRWTFLAVLFLVSTSNYVDRNIISVLLEPIKQEYGVSDTLLGLLSGVTFAMFYVTLGIPVARWADRGNRRTIITAALAAWSVMTVLCGLAQSFWQLALARVGVGAGESGAIPPAQSLIAEYFSPDRRASALAIFTAAATAGYVGGFVIGGQIAANYGWRAAFIAVGLPGLVLALIAHFGLKEPRAILGFPTQVQRESLGATLRTLLGKRSYRELLVGLTLYFFIAYGAVVFIPSFLVRVLGVPIGTVGTVYGTAVAIGGIIGTIAGGVLADRLGRRDVRWLAWLPAAACGLAFPAYVLAFAMPAFPAFIAFALLASAFVTGGLPPIFSALHAVCGSRRRATAVAISLFVANLIGLGVGPLVTGALSDALSSVYGARGLQYALMLVMIVVIGAAVFFYRCGRAMPEDLED